MSLRVSRRAAMPAVTILFVLALAGAASPSAHADLLGLGALTGSNCPAQQLSQPFAQWGDGSLYHALPGGTFEPGGPDWSTTGGAGVTAGNEPWLVNDSSDGNSLALPLGSSATSPATCVSVTSPVLRFFATSSDASSGSSLMVEVLFRDTAGLLDSLPIGTVSAAGDWRPTPDYLVVANLLSLVGGNYNDVAFRFTPQGDAAWQIDDVYVDPWSKG